MTPFLVLATIAVYFIVLFAISWLAGRHADNQGFFIGNRKSSWYVVAFAMIGSSISGVTFISVPGWVAVNNFFLLTNGARLYCRNFVDCLCFNSFVL